MITSYIVSAIIIWRFAGGTIIELGVAIAICWGILTGLYLVQ